MIGHDVTLSETNQRGWVPLCTCGWRGAVSPAVAYRSANTKRMLFRAEVAREAAMTQFEGHLRDVGDDIARRSDEALAQHGRVIELANATLQRRGRWGRG